VEILLKSGERLVKTVDIPKGDPRDPMEAGDIAQKVKFFAGSRDQNKVDRIVDTILNLEKVNNIKELASFI